MVIWLSSHNPNFTCSCSASYRYLGPRNPLRFQCPSCGGWLAISTNGQLEPYEVKVCKVCSFDLVRRVGKNGVFDGCGNWPDCKGYGWVGEWRVRYSTQIIPVN